MKGQAQFISLDLDDTTAVLLEKPQTAAGEEDTTITMFGDSGGTLSY